MKYFIATLLLCLFIISSNNTQALETFWYSDIALDEVGQIVDNANINVRLTILEGNTSLGTETLNNISTDQFAVFTVRVNGTGIFDAVDVQADTRLKTEVQEAQGPWVLVSVRAMYEVQGRGIFQITDWSLTGNAHTTAGTNFLGTTDDEDLVFKINNTEAGRINRDMHNTTLGYQALTSATSANNTAIGYQALLNNTTGWSNTAIGNQALYSNTFRGNQVAVGDSALFNNGNNFGQSIPYPDSAKAIRNTAVGSKALFSNEVGFWNTAVGYNAAYYNIKGKSLTAIGTEALMHNTSGWNNTAVGTWALYANTTGNWNTGFGSGALKSNTTGDTNTAVGLSAMYYNNGNGNVAMGMFAAPFNTTGNGNTAIGTESLYHNWQGSYNVSVGYHTGHSYWWRSYNNSTFLGAFADANFDGATNSIAIGYGTIVNASNQVRIGNSSITSLYCQGAYAATSANQPNMYVSANGQIMRSTAQNRTFNNLTLNGNVLSSLIPDATSRNLGSTSNRWGSLYVSGNSIHIGTNANEAEISYTANSHLKFTKPVLTPNSIVSLTGNATYTGTAEAGLVLYVYNTSGTDYTFESINVPNGQMKVFVYTGSAWVATN